MHNNVDGDIVKNAASNSEKVMQHCFRPYDPKCQTLKYVIWFKFPLFSLECSLLTYDATKNPIEADHNASEDSTKP